MSDQATASTATVDGMNSYLLARYGIVMTAANLAEQLQTSLTALRIARHRGRDLPPVAELPGRGRRWLTIDVASWLISHSAVATEHQKDPRLDSHSARTPRPRRGRPRTHVTTKELGVEHV